MRKYRWIVATLVAFAGLNSANADDVSGSRELLCNVQQVTACVIGQTCVSLQPWELNIPDFVIVDLDAKLLSTTAASQENRSTPIRNIERADGLLLLQGAQSGRAFSIAITEITGEASLAIATDGVNMSAFGMCTTLPVSAPSDG